MKKLLSLLLILTLSLSLVFAMTACGDNDGDDNNSDNGTGSGTPNEDDVCDHEYVDKICRHCGAAEPYYDPDGWTKPEK
jgi:hypothetical protein